MCVRACAYRSCVLRASRPSPRRSWRRRRRRRRSRSQRRMRCRPTPRWCCTCRRRTERSSTHLSRPGQRKRRENAKKKRCTGVTVKTLFTRNERHETAEHKQHHHTVPVEPDVIRALPRSGPFRTPCRSRRRCRWRTCPLCSLHTPFPPLRSRRPRRTIRSSWRSRRPRTCPQGSWGNCCCP